MINSSEIDSLPLDQLLKELHFPDMIDAVIRKKIAEKRIAEIADSAYSGEGFDFALCRRMPATRLTVVVFLLQQKYNEYKSKGVSDQIIFDTFRDVSLRASLYYQKTGKIGISKQDVIWFRHIMNVNMFKLGVLQFQPFKMIYLDEETLGEAYMTFDPAQKALLAAGAPVINCHIQQGVNLSPAEVQRSLDHAKLFFKTCFPEIHFQAFLCYSWLLYPPMIHQLPSQSNIRRFAERFLIIGSCNDMSQAKEYLFGVSPKPTAEKMTSLQKMAANHIERFGFACGMIKI